MSDAAPGSALARGRLAFDMQQWAEAYELLRESEAHQPLAGADLHRLAMAAALLGHDRERIEAWERAYHAFLTAGELTGALRTTFWLSVALMSSGEVARASGWFSRGQRLLEAEHGSEHERAYLAIPAALQRLNGGDAQAAMAIFDDVGSVALRIHDRDLETFSRLGGGQSRVLAGDVAGGMALFDEAMLAVTTAEVSPLVVGIVYCGVIEMCERVFEVQRAQEWTTALQRWCDAHAEVVPFRGQCSAFRSQILRLHGAWPDAIAEARRAQEILAGPPPHPALGSTFYYQGEVLRLRGQLAEAEVAYREASRWGRPPEPGLALLRLAEGRTDAAQASIRRVLGEAEDPLTRARLLPAFVAILVAAGHVEEAQGGADELAAIAEQLGVSLLRALAAQSVGRVLLARGRPDAALLALRRAASDWIALEAPYEAACTRALIARACRAVGDADTADLELDAARWALERLGVDPTGLEIEGVAGTGTTAAMPLTPREVEVVRLVAAGRTNREIATALVISEKTVARHVSNILAKLELPSRAAATAYAYEHGIV